MNTILITGINGFLGSSLAKRFSENFNVVGTEFSLDNLFRVKDFNFSIHSSEQSEIEKLFNQHKVDIIIHTATFYGRNQEDITQISQSNLFSPFYLLDTAIKNKTKLFINTDTALDRFTSTYSLSKKQFRDWLYFRSSEIKAANIQLEHFYGPGASQTNFITSMIKRLSANELSIDLTGGEQKRDFIYYEDVLDAYELIINSENKLTENFNHFEVGSGEVISIKELMIMLKELTRSKSILNFGAIPYRENEVMGSVPDTHEISKLGWKSKVSLKEGLLKTISGLN